MPNSGVTSTTKSAERSRQWIRTGPTGPGHRFSLTELEAIAREVRAIALQMIYEAGSGHPGGSLSAADMLTYLYFRELRLDVAAPDWPERDRFVLSKGHCCPALYAVLGLRGCLGSDPAAAWRGFRKLGGILQGHPHVLDLPWAETSTGSLGQGFSASIGMALGVRHRGIRSRVYAMLGDGELQEGEVWEGAMFAGHHRLANLCVLVDFNKMQSDDTHENIMCLDPLPDKWTAFNWHVLEIDGHSFAEIEAALDKARNVTDRPTAIIAHTSKGRGVSYMDGIPSWHGSVKLRESDQETALNELAISADDVRRYLDRSVWQPEKD